MSHCQSEEDHCSTSHEEACCSETQNDACCPIETVIDKWETAFTHAKHQVMVDVLKEKITAKWGHKMDKVGDAVIEAMEAEWAATFQKQAIQSTLREKVGKALCSESS